MDIRILPLPGAENILITSALPYVNNITHLGNIIGVSWYVSLHFFHAHVLTDFVVCRCIRSLLPSSRPTDSLHPEYGTATATKALSEGIDPATLCSKYHTHAIHKEIYNWFRIEFDYFGRTPTSERIEIVQDVFTKLWNEGFIEERETTQAFCPVWRHSSFLADRFVEGECSLCHYLGARGDQVGASILKMEI